VTSADAAPPDAGSFTRRRLAFRRWRRGRPFWGGLVTILSAALFYFSVHLNPTSFSVSFGQQGFLAWLTPLIMLLCAFLGWFSPSQRIFYGVVAVATAVYGLISVNLGGFFAGTLTGMVGGALIASWNPVPPAQPAGTAEADGTADGTPAAADQPDSDTWAMRFAAADTATDLDIVPGLGPDTAAQSILDTGTTAAPGTESGAHAAPDGPDAPPEWPPPGHGAEPTRPDMSRSGPLTDHLPTATRSPLAPAADEESTSDVQRHAAPRNRRGPHATVVLVLALAVAGAALMALRTTTSALAAPCPVGAGPVAVVPAALLLAASPSDPAPSPSDPPPSPAPAPSSAPAPVPSSAAPATTAPAPPVTTTGTCTTGTGTPTSASPRAAVKLAPAAGQPPVAAGTATLTAATLAMQGLRYDGVVDLPRRDGTVVTVLRFSMSSAAHTTFKLDTAGAGGDRIVLTAATLTVSGNVTFYCTSFSAFLLGTIPIDFTPINPPVAVPPAMTVDRATIGLVYAVADQLTASGFAVA